MGVVYVLTNPAMPGYVKIGHTSQPVEKRIRSLSSKSSVPRPFECAAVWEFRDARAVEKALHDAFADQRGDVLREFFTVDPDRVVAILRQFGRRDVTPKGQAADDGQEARPLPVLNGPGDRAGSGPEVRVR